VVQQMIQGDRRNQMGLTYPAGLCAAVPLEVIRRAASYCDVEAGNTDAIADRCRNHVDRCSGARRQFSGPS